MEPDPTNEPQVTPRVTPQATPVDTTNAEQAPEPVVEQSAPEQAEQAGALAAEPASAAGPPNQEPPGAEPDSRSAPSPSTLPAQPGLSAEELADIREIIVSANPEAVPELIQGSTLAELKASVETAKSAYQRIAEGVRSTPVPIPAGQPGRQPEVLPENATPAQRIAAGLRARKAS